MAAGEFTHYVLCRGFEDINELDLAVKSTSQEEKEKSVMQILADGGQEGVKIVFNMIPMLILAIFLVNVLKATGTIELISLALAPLLNFIGLPEATVLPIVTKFIAGGTAFMAVTIDLVNQGLISPLELNRMAEFTTNPLDIVGVALFATAGKRVSSVLRYAVYGALFGVLLRGIAHLIIF